MTQPANSRISKANGVLVQVSGLQKHYPASAMTNQPLNRLQHERSPYLKQHADNPVDWFPWGQEAFDLAERTNKPILLSVGYSACHWCHVMAHESFENDAVAQLMNAHFVNVKLDREERPDIDQLYQGVVQLFGRGGGWPLTVFLTPQREPFFGGTYFPPTPRHGLPGFSTLLERIADSWADDRSSILAQAKEVTSGLQQYTQFGLERENTASKFTAQDVVNAAHSMSKRVDTVYGGFGDGGPKFPNPMNVAMLLRGFRRSGEQPLLDNARRTLDAMALGGIFDQLGGGFHRYSVDERWLIPHFEKMLYDNAQLLHLYTEAWQLTASPLYRKTAEATASFLLREMRSKDGCFFAAYDADSEGEEGKFFAWTRAEIESLLPTTDADLFCKHYNVTAAGNFEHHTNVLEVVRPVNELAQELGTSADEIEAKLASARKTLLAVRSKRVWPGLDDKVLTGWNGLTIRGLAFAAGVFDRPEWTAAAKVCADVLLKQLVLNDGTLMRVWQDQHARLPGMAEDYGHLSLGLLALYQTTFEAQYLESAAQLADAGYRLCWDLDAQAFRTAPKSQADLLMSTFALHDNAIASGASTLCDAFVSLAALIGDGRWLERAEVYLSRMKAEMAGRPLSYGHLWMAADSLVDGAAEVTLLGDDDGSFLKSIRSQFRPTLSVHSLPTGSQPAPAAEAVLRPRMGAKAPAAFLCQHFSCQRPVHDVATLQQLFASFDAVFVQPST